MEAEQSVFHTSIIKNNNNIGLMGGEALVNDFENASLHSESSMLRFSLVCKAGTDNSLNSFFTAGIIFRRPLT